MRPYLFRRATKGDLPMLRRWLATPEICRWWGHPDEQFALLEGDLSEPQMTMWIVTHSERPFAFAQHYRVHAWPQPHFAHLPSDAQAIDAFIGEPDMIGVGHGSTFLRLLAEQLRASGAPVVVIDPAFDNLRARRAYAKAGFTGELMVETEQGAAVLMTFSG
jgi:aminoglycoside 6'-N-acetyltransferase